MEEKLELEEEFQGFLERGYVNVWMPKGLRKPILKAMYELGFGSIASLVRTATREYLEKRGYVKRREVEAVAGVR